MIGYEQALKGCRTDPEAAARLLCEFSRELDQLKAEIAALKAENAALRRFFLGDPFVPAVNTA